MDLDNLIYLFNMNKASLAGVLLQVIVILIIFLFISKKNFSIWILFETIFEKSYDFFESIVWEKQSRWVKTYVILLFFTILISNIIWLIVEIISPFFWNDEAWDFIIENYIKIPSSDINFNLAMASISIFVIMIVQFKSLWLKNFFYEYLPIFWKKYISIEKGNMKPAIYYPLSIFVKIFDIVISLFLWLLDVIWLFAKIISLSFRLFWNITSWTILLAMSIVWISSLTNSFLWFDFPIILPVIIYLQELLVAVIQAFVFPLLIAIFIRVAATHES